MEEITNQSIEFVKSEMLAGLPEPVQRYMNYTGVVGQPWIKNVLIRQSGTFRQGRERPWMPMSAKQQFTTDPPSFTWDARFKVAGLSLLSARDCYENGHGHISGKLAGVIPVFDERGEKLDQGTMLRFLGEMIWFPTAFLGRNITWEEVDGQSARATFTDHGRSVGGVFHFDDQGRPINFTTNRYREVDGEYSLDAWSTPITGYDKRAGLNLPVRGQAVWNLPEGDMPYANLEILEVLYNSDR